MCWNVYVLGDKLIIPTSAKTTAGFYLEIDPVFSASKDDESGSSTAIASALARGNPALPTPDWKRGNKAVPVVLRHGGVNTWPAFVNKADCWRVLSNSDSYVIVPCVRMPRNTGWQEDRDRGVAIPDRSDLMQVACEIFQVIRNSG